MTDWEYKYRVLKASVDDLRATIEDLRAIDADDYTVSKTSQVSNLEVSLARSPEDVLAHYISSVAASAVEGAIKEYAERLKAGYHELVRIEVHEDTASASHKIRASIRSAIIKPSLKKLGETP